MNIKNTINEHYRKFFDLHAKGIALDEDDHLNLDWAEDLVKNCFIPNVMYWRDIEKEMPPEHEKVLVQLPDNIVLMAQMDSNGGWGIYWADGQKSMDIERPVLKWCELPACT